MLKLISRVYSDPIPSIRAPFTPLNESKPYKTFTTTNFTTVQCFDSTKSGVMIDVRSCKLT